MPIPVMVCSNICKLLTNNVMADGAVGLVVSVLRRRLGRLRRGQVPIPVLGLCRCSVTSGSIGRCRRRPGTLVRRLGVVVGPMGVVVSSLIFVIFVCVGNVIDGRSCSLSTLDAGCVVG